MYRHLEHNVAPRQPALRSRRQRQPTAAETLAAHAEALAAAAEVEGRYLRNVALLEMFAQEVGKAK